MKIKYYEVGCTGYISEREIYTKDKHYVSHTDETVTFTDTYEDSYGDLQTEEVVGFRTYDALKQKQIEKVKKFIEEYQKELYILESATDYEHYWKLLREK